MTQVTHRIFNTNLQCSFACLHSCDFFKIWSRARTELLKIRVRNFTAGETPSLHNKCTTQTKSKLLLQLLVPEHCVPWSSGVAIGCAVHAAHRCGGEGADEPSVGKSGDGGFWNRCTRAHSNLATPLPGAAESAAAVASRQHRIVGVAEKCELRLRESCICRRRSPALMSFPPPSPNDPRRLSSAAAPLAISASATTVSHHGSIRVCNAKIRPPPAPHRI